MSLLGSLGVPQFAAGPAAPRKQSALATALAPDPSANANNWGTAMAPDKALPGESTAAWAARNQRLLQPGLWNYDDNTKTFSAGGSQAAAPGS